jgi:hypothetical protein
MTLLLDTRVPLCSTEDLPRLGKRADRARKAALAASELLVLFEIAIMAIECEDMPGCAALT